MDNNDIKNRKEILFERTKKLWKGNVLSSNGFDRIIQKINRNELDQAEELLSKIELEHERSTDEDKEEEISRTNNYYSGTGNSKRYIDQALKKITNSDMANTKLTIENDSLRKSIERLAAENEIIKENLKIIQNENLELKNKHQQNRIDEKIPDYVKDVSQKLDIADKFFSDMSRNWSIAGLILALCAVASAFCTFIFGLDVILSTKELTPTAIIYTFIRGGLGIALLSWISYISFSNARNYTHESILRKDRQHALTFGRLFLQIYGSTASKEDAIHVFKDWNMSGDTAFSSKSSTPPSPLSYLNSVRNTLSKATSTTKNVDKVNE
ncbi:hypothetical protein ACQYD5_002936 [Serratia marcescens]